MRVAAWAAATIPTSPWLSPWKGARRAWQTGDRGGAAITTETLQGGGWDVSGLILIRELEAIFCRCSYNGYIVIIHAHPLLSSFLSEAFWVMAPGVSRSSATSSGSGVSSPKRICGEEHLRRLRFPSFGGQSPDRGWRNHGYEDTNPLTSVFPSSWLAKSRFGLPWRMHR
jgi:hypothetical protein